MIKITEDFINSLAPNQSAISNGWGLVRKNSFVNLSIDSLEELLFGECKGSGASNYITSGDFIKPENPVYYYSNYYTNRLMGVLKKLPPENAKDIEELT